MNDIEIVKKGYLRHRLSGQYSQNGQLRYPKEDWFVFKIGSSASGRILDLFSSEKESNKRNAVPRDRVYLRDVSSVLTSGRDKPNMFVLCATDGTMHYMEAHSENECCEWVFALNAVLFGKGPDGRHVIQFGVNVWKCPVFSYHGAGLLEIREDLMIVWSQGERDEVVRWKLGHIRSFKAKQNVLEIVAGSRSSTGEGVFMYGTQESVLITHTLETVIDRLARQKRAKNMKTHQALPPLPPPNLPPSAFPTSPQPLPPQSHVTLVRGRTDTKDLVPSFSDIPETLLRQSKDYDYADSNMLRHKPPIPPLHPEQSPYNKLECTPKINQRDASKNKSLPSLGRRDIYSSNIEGLESLKRPSHLSENKLDYSYVETDPRVKLLSPTEASGTVGLGEIRHRTSPQPKRKVSSNRASSATILSSEADKGDYSFLNPVSTTDVLPGGMYNQLDFKAEIEDPQSVKENDYDQPPPLPPPLTVKGYENVGPRPARQSSDEDKKKELFDSHGSIEILLESGSQQSDSPKLVKKSVSPRVSPRVSPTVPRKIEDEYDEVQLMSEPSVVGNSSDSSYSRISHSKLNQKKSLGITMDSSHGYSQLSSFKEKPSCDLDSPDGCGQPLPQDVDNPYSQLSRNKPMRTSRSDYDQLVLHDVRPNQGGTVDECPSYSKFNHPTNKPPTPITHDYDRSLTSEYSTLNSHGASIPATKPSPNYEEVMCSTVPHPHPGGVSSNINTHAYDEVTPTNPSNESRFIGSPGSSIYEDDFTNIEPDPVCGRPPDPTNGKPKSTPPVPPRRGVTTKNSRPPPVKPKPYTPKNAV